MPSAPSYFCKTKVLLLSWSRLTHEKLTDSIGPASTHTSTKDRRGLGLSTAKEKRQAWPVYPVVGKTMLSKTLPQAETANCLGQRPDAP